MCLIYRLAACYFFSPDTITASFHFCLWSVWFVTKEFQLKRNDVDDEDDDDDDVDLRDWAAAINPTDGDETGVHSFTAGSTRGDSWSKVNETSDGRGGRRRRRR